MYRRKILTFFLMFLLFFQYFAPLPAKAWSDLPNLSVNGGDMVTNVFGTGGIFAQLGTNIAQYVKDNYEKMLVEAAKMTALWGEQKIIAAMIGGSGGGGAITNWGVYLYVNPQQRAVAQMNYFFNTVSKGRLSSVNYEGIGPRNYDSYLKREAQKSYTGIPFQTNIQSQATDPTQLFSAGNMKGIMSYMQCANNVACYTLVSTAKYNQEFAKAQDIARSEQSNGFLPQKKNGAIIKPAALASAAFSQIDQIGTKVIMNADPKNGLVPAVQQIGEGMLMNIAARSLNYAVSDEAGKAAIRDKNDQAPFSLSYSTAVGIGINAGGITSTGIGGKVGINGQIGNTQISGGIGCSTSGCDVTSSTTKTDTFNNTLSATGSGPKPQITITPPSITCATDNVCGQNFKCLSGKCVLK